ncbi:MAG: PA0069 family radical SAM protein [Planctomycetales bacterium]
MRHGSNLDPPNRFETVRREIDLEHLEWDEEYLRERENRPIEYVFDDSKSIVSENNSPDIPFRYSLNPYRGCVHACPYCYARNTHEYLGYNAGLDFETKIVVKKNAPGLFRDFLTRKSWRPETIMFSGVTDCYQPAERQFRLTRGCLETAWEFRQPVSVITKNALVVRDLDLLSQMAERNLVRVFVSVTTLEPELASVMEPRASIPSARLRAINMLADASVPAGVMVAPVIPGLNDTEIPGILAAAKDAGAATASYGLLRLSAPVEPVFLEWLERTQPDKRAKIERRIRDAHGGKLNNSEWGERMRGTGEIAAQIGNLFQVFRRKHGLDGKTPPLDFNGFQRPDPDPKQRKLF